MHILKGELLSLARPCAAGIGRYVAVPELGILLSDICFTWPSGTTSLKRSQQPVGAAIFGRTPNAIFIQISSLGCFC